MQELKESLQLVIQSPYFLWYCSLILSLGMVIGAKFDDSFRGFRRSVALITPYFLILIITNGSRMYNTSLAKPLTATAYNSIITLSIITFLYILGLFIGHMIDLKGKEKAHAH